jgi:outer membrane lipoprotein SlyB
MAKRWIQKATASIKRRGTKGKCTPITKPGCTGRAKALAKTFKKMAKKRKKQDGGQVGDEFNIDSLAAVHPWMHRALTDTLRIPRAGGPGSSVSTFTFSDNKGHYVAPTIRKVGNKLQEYSYKDAEGIARKNKDAVRFNTLEEAEKFSQGFSNYLGSREEKSLGGILSSTIGGAGTGLVAGPFGAIVGGLAGLGAGIFGHIKGKRAEEQQQSLYSQQQDAYNTQQAAIEARKEEADREQYLGALEANQSANPYTPTFPLGGLLPYTGAQAEIEGGEVVQFPNGNLDRPRGPSHAEGGIDINAPEDTRIFSDRLEYEKGVTYAAKADAIRKEIEKYKKLLT